MPILETIKQMLGISSEDTSFDAELIVYINTALAIACQLGVEEAKELPIINEITEWMELLDDREDLEMLKTFIYLKVKSMFDPPTNSAARDAIDRITKELEWRITNMLLINNESEEEVKEDE